MSYMDLDQASDQPYISFSWSGPPSEGVHWSHPPPSNPDLLRLKRESEKAKARTLEPCLADLNIAKPPLVLNNSRPPRPCGPRAQGVETPHGQADDPELKKFKTETVSVMETSLNNAIRKSDSANKRTKSFLDDNRVAKKTQAPHKSIIRRREHSSGDVSSILPSASTHRLKLSLTEPVISTASSRGAPIPVSFARSIIRAIDYDVNYDFPSSTPTPPSKLRLSQASGSQSSGSNTTSQKYSSSSSMSPLGVHHGTSSRTDLALSPTVHLLGGTATSMPFFESPPDDADMTGDPGPHSTRALPLPIPEAVCIPSQTTVPPQLFRPFVPPSSTSGATQFDRERPRASQHPPPLGMRPRVGQSSKFQTKRKDFKVPFAKQASTGHATGPEAQVAAPLMIPSSHTGFVFASQNQGHSVDRRSLSPVIPDPPHVAARMQELGTHKVQGGAASGYVHAGPVLGRSARRPEPGEEEESTEENQDANSSADMWAFFDS